MVTGSKAFFEGANYLRTSRVCNARHVPLRLKQARGEVAAANKMGAKQGNGEHAQCFVMQSLHMGYEKCWFGGIT